MLAGSPVGHGIHYTQSFGIELRVYGLYHLGIGNAAVLLHHKRDYDFIIEIVDVRVDGSNVSEKKDSIPHSVSMALKYCSTGDNYYADDIIKDLVDGDYKSFNDYASPKYNAALKELNPKVYELLEEVSKEK